MQRRALADIAAGLAALTVGLLEALAIGSDEAEVALDVLIVFSLCRYFYALGRDPD